MLFIIFVNKWSIVSKFNLGEPFDSIVSMRSILLKFLTTCNSTSGETVLSNFILFRWVNGDPVSRLRTSFQPIVWVCVILIKNCVRTWRNLLDFVELVSFQLYIIVKLREIRETVANICCGRAHIEN